MEKSFDLLSIGDATLDVFLVPSESELLCSLDDKQCKICFSYGDKIPVKSLDYTVGGNAANNVVGTKRLGLNVAIVLTLGDDSIGNQITERLAGEGVDMTYVHRQLSTSSNYSTIISYSGERTIFTYHAPREYKFPLGMPKTSWAYLTSMGASFKPFYDQFVKWLRENLDVKLAFNPGSHQFRAGIDSFREILTLTNVLFVNREEAESITGIKSKLGEEKELLNKLNNLGVKMPVVTDGGNGSFVFDGSKYFKLGVLPIDSYERTGAGDAYGSGFLSAIIKGRDCEEALLWGTLNSASVIGYVGSQRGLIRESELGDWLDRAKKCNLKVEEI